MNQADSDDTRQRAKWAKYKEYKRPNDHRVMVYSMTRIVVDLGRKTMRCTWWLGR